VSQQELEQANTAYLAAKAELERTQQAVKEAEIQQGYASIRAPIGGVIVDKKVNPGDTVSPGQALLSMYDRERMQMIATVRESLAMGLKVGQQVAARLDALDLNCHATISEIVPEAHAESRSFLVKVTGPCPPNVYSGMFGRIFIPLGDEEVLVVPPQAVRKVGQLHEVDVLENGTRRRHVVQLGRTLAEGREVLSGLKAGERVVMPQGSTVREGRS
jgi:RND family efflux transporter MFP subunit